MHLVAGTASDNTADKLGRGRMRPMKGVSNGNSKLTDTEVAEIRRLYVRGNGKMLAKRYGVSATQISNIVNNKQR